MSESKNEVKRGRGRPAVYVGALYAYIVGVISAVNAKFPGEGLTKASDLLTHAGAVRNSAEKRYGIDLHAIATAAGLDKPAYRPSLVPSFLSLLLKRNGGIDGVQLKRGRPRIAKAA